MPGWRVENLEPRPDLVVVGNVCRRDNAEARAAIDGGMRYASFPETLEQMFLDERPGYVVAGTHGKTTTTTLLAFLLHAAGKDPGFLVGGVPRDFAESFRLGSPKAPFVIEGDEYDSAFFEKTPKFWRYRPHAAILTSVEHDHIDIYPDMASYRAAFEGFVSRIDEDGVLVAWAGDREVRAVAAKARCRVVYYALDGEDTGDVTPTWLAAEVLPTAGAQPFDLFVGGSATGRVYSPLSGRHNLKNALSAIALAAESGGVSVRDLAGSLQSFRGVRRRQELLGISDGVRVYEDFAHHPTAVRETLAGLRARHPEGRLFAVFEPRSATASRSLHQAEYPDAFRSADVAILAPVGRPEIADGERLDVEVLVRAIAKTGREAHAAPSIDAIVERLTAEARPGDTVVLMSNGAFGGIYDRVLVSLVVRAPLSRTMNT
jgi:UDP-N-acetylmuramate: L-alanyl-gamma-D-glutamyl-meso-diaminopimelate ligase